MKIKFYFFSLILLLVAGVSYSQWSVDPNTNTPVCTATGEQAVPKISLTSDGGCYITWFDNRSGSYAVYLQRLNSAGVPQFTANGLLISSNAQNTSLVDWDMITDDSNNAIIAFTDIRAGGQINPYIYKISPTGTFLWGANGISLNSQSSVFQANPKLAKCTGNNIFVTWIYSSSPRVAKYQRISPGGVKQFAADGLSISGTGSEAIDFPNVVTSDNGSAIMTFIGYTGSFISPGNYKIYTQKISSNGGSVWNANFDTVYSLGRGSGFNPPQTNSDGNNGFVICWQDDRSSTNASNVYVQRVNAAGQKLFPVNGSAGDVTAGMVRNTMQACVNTTTNETFMFWKEANGGQTQYSCVGQRFSAAGDRLWTDAGLNVIPMGNNSFVTLDCQSVDTNAVVYINDGVFGSSNNIVRAAKFNRSGSIAWNSGALMTIGGSTGAKSRMAAKINSNKMSIVMWGDSRSGIYDIYAQNINNNGTLGPATNIQQISGETPNGFELKQNFPNPFNPTTNIVYSLKVNSAVTIKVYNTLGKEVTAVSFGMQNAGSYSYSLDAGALNLSSGIYYYAIQAGDFKDIKKMMLVK
ncbi:MAG: T9SS type A sorting domain-containing protein [Bacteroidetes bacterium]|nr:T9SS type A sorting domain-containing protein [Bacteroidota bacterium]MBX7044930.1 T9SS type A sorting domain-containing protein [Ignavibacteria bacterium]